MGFIGNLLGGGNNFKAQSADLMDLTNPGQVGASYGGAQNALAQQQALVNALQAQNGIQNQSQVYNQLQQVAAGQGPNPAQAMLANSTGQNVANQAALMASQRGVGANPALISRQAAQQGAGIQQDAAGQAAALQAQQSLGAIGQAGQLAGQQAAQQIGGVGNLNQFQQAEQGQILNAANSQNNARIANVSQQNSANAGVAAKQAEGQNNILGNVTSAVGTAVGLPFAAGGQVAQSPVMIHLTGTGTKMAVGGNVGSKLQAGGKVPGKPVVGGAVNSYRNDTIDAKLSPGEIVLPRSIVQGKNPQKDAAAFVGAILAKNGKTLPKKK